MAEHLHDDSGVHALGQQQSRCGVPPVLQSDLAHARLVQEGLPGTPVRRALDRPAVGLTDDQVVVLSQRARGAALLELLDPVSPERLDDGAGKATVRCGPVGIERPRRRLFLREREPESSDLSHPTADHPDGSAVPRAHGGAGEVEGVAQHGPDLLAHVGGEGRDEPPAATPSPGQP
ncbi:MAG TPA: hypothetical protein VJ352_00320 [Geodermatophilus sp.]|nr:hypothetical protein [Geodermatophilus sp.]